MEMFDARKASFGGFGGLMTFKKKGGTGACIGITMEIMCSNG
jgi:hypothetical protein